jgi:cytidylate kinase
MTGHQSIVISGDLGSGKTTVAKELAQRLDLPQISVGNLYREMAQSRGMSALQLNLHAELDDAVDGYVDQLQSKIAKSGEQLVVDGRLAWFFFTGAFKVHLVVDPAVAAQRVLSRPQDGVEIYSSLDEAQELLRNRSESERARFFRRYHVDKGRLRNYDMVCDTTRASSGEVADQIVAAFGGSGGEDILTASPPLLLLDPRRIYPTEKIQALRGLWESDSVTAAGEGSPATEPIAIGYADSYFYVVDGHRRLSASIQNGYKLVLGRLLAESDEQVVGGLTSRQYFDQELSPSMIYDWEAAHQIELPLPRRLQMLSNG